MPYVKSILKQSQWVKKFFLKQLLVGNNTLKMQSCKLAQTGHGESEGKTSKTNVNSG